MFPVESSGISRSTERPLKLAVITPRYHPEIIGGAETYLLHFLRGLSRRGVEVSVLTTRDIGVRFENGQTLLWENALAPDAALEGPSTVRRFRSSNLPPRLRSRFSRAVERAQETLQDGCRIETGASYLSRGFHALELWGRSFPFRWTGERADLELRETGCNGLALQVYALRPVGLSVVVDDRDRFLFQVSEQTWSSVELSFSERSRASVRIEVTPTFRPPGDKRELGVAVRSVLVRTTSGDTALALARDRESLLAELSTSELAPRLDAQGRNWGVWTSLKDALLKGPVSPSLALASLSCALRSDVVLATHAPFLTLGYGWAAGRLAGKPVLLMPFFHLRDPYHFRPWLRGFLERADRVLCLNGAMRSFVETQWGASASVLGGGIDPTELEDPAIDGARFRRRHGLDERTLVLMVARKVRSKGYQMVCEAIRELRSLGVDCQFVLVGPDEDGAPLEPTIVRYLGALPRSELLDAIDACDVFVLPSSYESFGLVFLEAWMRRKPVVGHERADSVRELIRAGSDGETVSSSEELTRVLHRLLLDRALRRRLGEAGYAKTRRYFTWDHVVDRGLNLMEELRDA